jgi:hypothetical protein
VSIRDPLQSLLGDPDGLLQLDNALLVGHGPILDEGLSLPRRFDGADCPLDRWPKVLSVPASIPALEHLFQVGQVRPQDRRCLQALLEVASEFGDVAGTQLRHKYGTDIFHCSVSVHAVSKDQLVKNQQLNRLIILGWKQAGFETITKK